MMSATMMVLLSVATLVVLGLLLWRSVCRVLARLQASISGRLSLLGMQVSTALEEKITNVHEHLKSMEAKFDQTSGGLWRTARGDLLRVRDMSDGHIRNVLKMREARQKGAPSDKLEELMRRELRRREEDREWRRADEPDKMMRVSTALVLLRTAAAEIAGHPSLGADTAKRIADEVTRCAAEIEEVLK